MLYCQVAFRYLQKIFTCFVFKYVLKIITLWSKMIFFNCLQSSTAVRSCCGKSKDLCEGNITTFTWFEPAYFCNSFAQFDSQQSLSAKKLWDFDVVIPAGFPVLVHRVCDFYFLQVNSAQGRGRLFLRLALQHRLLHRVIELLAADRAFLFVSNIMETCVLFHAKQGHKNKSKRIVSRIAACTVPK